MAGGHFDQRVQVARVAVDTVRRDQTDQVERVLIARALSHRINESRFLEEIPISDALIDARQILIHNAACPHRDVSDLGVMPI